MKKEKNKNSNEEKWEGFDDCLICRAMKAAEKEKRELGMAELKAAFDAQNRRQNFAPKNPR
ncbi:MAG: hypothetical protein HYV67_04605 [Candidatus Taylorbacteria bacterium]|nr:hypothetical protein [Candidatus Taylorbacteria bacterium]